MKITLSNIARIKESRISSVLITTFYLAMIGTIYLLFRWNFHWHAILVGIPTAAVIGLTTSLAEIFIIGKYFRKSNFITLLLIRLLIYSILVSGIIIVFLAFHNSMMKSITLTASFNDVMFQQYIFSTAIVMDMIFVFIAIFFVSFVRQINRLMGRNVLSYFITGKYRQPVEEERIIMFLDITGSTSLAERMGHNKYHNFLNDFFYDITPAIVASKGEIYQYIGDEVVVSWTMKNGIKDNNCIRCYFMVVGAIQMKFEYYDRKYGAVPEFKAGIHSGPVIIGEVGDVKREIVFSGDTVNAAARIRTECTHQKRHLLISGDLLKSLSISKILTPEFIAKIKLRGKETETELYGISEAE